MPVYRYYQSWIEAASGSTPKTLGLEDSFADENDDDFDDDDDDLSNSIPEDDEHSQKGMSHKRQNSADRDQFTFANETIKELEKCIDKESSRTTPSRTPMASVPTSPTKQQLRQNALKSHAAGTRAKPVASKFNTAPSLLSDEVDENDEDESEEASSSGSSESSDGSSEKSDGKGRQPVEEKWDDDEDDDNGDDNDDDDDDDEHEGNDDDSIIFDLDEEQTPKDALVRPRSISPVASAKTATVKRKHNSKSESSGAFR